jgi:hypothetical protein
MCRNTLPQPGVVITNKSKDLEELLDLFWQVRFTKSTALAIAAILSCLSLRWIRLARSRIDYPAGFHRLPEISQHSKWLDERGRALLRLEIYLVLGRTFFAYCKYGSLCVAGRSGVYCDLRLFWIEIA